MRFYPIRPLAGRPIFDTCRGIPGSSTCVLRYGRWAGSGSQSPPTSPRPVSKRRLVNRCSRYFNRSYRSPNNPLAIYVPALNRFPIPFSFMVAAQACSSAFKAFKVCCCRPPSSLTRALDMSVQITRTQTGGPTRAPVSDSHVGQVCEAHEQPASTRVYLVFSLQMNLH